MKRCKKCGRSITSADDISCYICSADFHSSCVDSNVETEGGRSIICLDCSRKARAPRTSKENDVTPMEIENLEQSVTTVDVEFCSFDREFTCVLFPGIVKNDEKALQCLGGIKGISQVYSQPLKKRLGLSYQPDNPFVKKLYADYKKTAGVLLKIRVKKVKTNNEVSRQVISTDVVGRVNSIYKFDSMCDFQYLPIYKEAPGEPFHCLVDKIIPSAPQDDVNFVIGQAPLFIVPASFTRSDRPISYAYTDKRYPDRSGTPDGTDEFHNKARSERGMPLGHWWHFNLTEDFPTEPNANCIKVRDAKYEYNPILRDEFAIVEKCFEERPIWSLNMIRYHTKLRLSSLKILVPCIGVFMKDGPWKSLWVKYGFDPRKEPSARIYQTLDFRLRHHAGVHCMVMTRDQIVHYKSTDRVRQQKRKNRTDVPPAEDVCEGAVLFRPGMAPAQRQIFYQICDVKLPEVESILAAEPAPGSTCHEKLGWLPPNTIENCRDFVFQSVKQTLLASHSAENNIEEGDDADVGSSDEDSQNSGDDITNDVDDMQ